MDKAAYIKQIDDERAAMDCNVRMVMQSAERFRPYDPELAAKYDELARQCGNIAAYIANRLI